MTGDYQQVVAFVRPEQLEPVEKALQAVHVAGVSMSRVKGYGEYCDFYARDWLDEYVRVEVFARRERSERIVEAILAAASTGTEGDGIVGVIPVEGIWRTRTREPAAGSDL